MKKDIIRSGICKIHGVFKSCHPRRVRYKKNPRISSGDPEQHVFVGRDAKYCVSTGFPIEILAFFSMWSVGNDNFKG